MTYFWLRLIHLTCAAFFIGGVFFELMIVSRAARELAPEPREQFAKAMGRRARQVMHWVVLGVYGAGFGLAWIYRDQLAQPFASHFGLLLSIKIVLALSILCHFLSVVFFLRKGRMTPKVSRIIHISVFTQMLGIVFLAKAMTLLNW